MPPAPTPRIADRYTVLRTLGQGAFGRTLLATDDESGRQVAIKMLDTQRVDSIKGFELFEREAAVMRSVRHHGVPEIYDSLRASWEGRPAAFLVMEFIEGKSLDALIKERHHLDPGDASHLLLELLGVLDYLHSRVPPILHRDIKPANIILRPDGYPTLVDFGAVRSAIAPTGQDGSTIVGTYGYMPYEQHMGQATPSSDLYALAATFLHLLSGNSPPTFMNADGRIAVPESLPGGERQQQVLSRMLQPSPAQRFQSARDVRQALLATERVALAPVARVGQVLTRRHDSLMELPPAPRLMVGDAAERYRKLAPSLWRHANPGGMPMGDSLWGVGIAIVIGLFTFGVFPAMIAAVGTTQRRRLKHFFTLGTPVVAEVTAIEGEKDPFGGRLGLVRFQFEADDQLHRGSDLVSQAVADRWRPGDQIEVLFLRDEDYDGVIVSTR
ncbi:MAG: serine/threonine-protein kinase [Gemmatimonadaceae bacterium]